MSHTAGKVYLLGGGPGDPELLTIKGLEILRMADVVLYDNLSSNKLLQHCSKDCEKIYVGKKAGKHILPQDEINKLLLKKVKNNKIIVRLKGGDPFVFGRGSEEALFLSKKNIPFEIIPGISSGIAVPAYAGIPLTHRNTAVSAAFITGHESDEKSNSDINWEKISTGADTLVFFMGVKNLKSITTNLIKNKRSGNTPAALIQNGTTSRQRVLKGRLKDIAEKAEKEKFYPPALFIVGDVVGFREELNWFESKPLFGRRIIVTRSRTQASKMVQHLNLYGADTIEFSVIRFQYPDDRSSFEKVFKRIKDYDWLIFTSANGVEYFINYFLKKKKDIRDLGSCRIASIGPATFEKIRSYLLSVDFQPKEYVAEAFVDEFLKAYEVKDKSILLVNSDKARPYIMDHLKERGAKIDTLTAYLTVPVKADKKELKDIDMVTFTSSSTANNFFKTYKGDKNFKIASIGPVTSKAVKENGFKVDVQAKEYTIPGLVKAILDYYSKIK